MIRETFHMHLWIQRGWAPNICGVTRNAVVRRDAEEVNQREPGLYQTGNSKNQILQRKYSKIGAQGVKSEI